MTGLLLLFVRRLKSRLVQVRRRECTVITDQLQCLVPVRNPLQHPERTIRLCLVRRGKVYTCSLQQDVAEVGRTYINLALRLIDLGLHYSNLRSLRCLSCLNQIIEALANMHVPVNTTTHRYDDDALAPVDSELAMRAPPIGPASTLPIPLPKLSKLNTMGPAVSSSVIDVLILAQVAVKPAPKNP
jgi:hypothetical protein